MRDTGAERIGVTRATRRRLVPDRFVGRGGAVDMEEETEDNLPGMNSEVRTDFVLTVS